MNESRRTHERVTLHTYMRHVAHINESCRALALKVGHVARMNVSCRTHE